MGSISSICRDWAQLGDTKPRPKGKKYIRWLGVRERETLCRRNNVQTHGTAWRSGRAGNSVHLEGEMRVVLPVLKCKRLCKLKGVRRDSPLDSPEEAAQLTS